jgi:hypothetical protein
MKASIHATPSEKPPIPHQTLNFPSNKAPRLEQQEVQPPLHNPDNIGKTPSASTYKNTSLTDTFAKALITPAINSTANDASEGHEQVPHSNVSGRTFASDVSKTYSSEQMLARINQKVHNAALANAENVNPIQYKLIKEIVSETMQSYQAQMKGDIQNMHLELIRQFQFQKVHFTYLDGDAGNDGKV